MALAMGKEEISLFNGFLIYKLTLKRTGCLLVISTFTNPQRIEIEGEEITMIWKV
jgi:hypothetical protein